MKKWFIKKAMQQMFSSDHSEGPSALAGILMKIIVAYLPTELATPGVIDPLSALSTALIGYAGARMYSKMRTPDSVR